MHKISKQERGRQMNKKRKQKIFQWIALVLLLCIGMPNISFRGAKAAETSMTLKYGGKKYSFAKTKQTTAKVNGKKVTTPIPGVIINGTNFVCPTLIKKKELGISYSYNSSKKQVTLKKDNTTIKLTMGKKIAKVNEKNVKLGTAPQRVYYIEKKKYYNILPARFVFETFGFSYTWQQKSRSCAIVAKTEATATPKVTNTPVITNTPDIVKTAVPTATANLTTATPKATTKPTVTATPKATTKPTVTVTPTVAPTKTPEATKEMKAMWISYLEFGSSAKTEAQFRKTVTQMFDNCVSYGMNTVIVQVRPFSDAMYKSSYFPWSKYASGTLGKDPGYDPLKIMIELAHKRGLKIQAWLNPYRITTGNTNVSALPASHPARKWANSSTSDVKRRVLSYGGNLYYNPSSSQVRTLIVNGVKEIVKNYDVDGIHFDDYFYPNLGTSYKTNFDAKEYDAYVEQCKKDGKTAKTIVKWRRGNVNALVKRVHTAVKGLDPNVEFGISPAGNIDNLTSSSAYYVDIQTWMSTDTYVDYICPQIYWSFNNAVCPYKATVKRWADLKKSDAVDLYIGLAVYRAGTTIEKEWSTSNTVLKRQVVYGRSVKGVSGFAFYRYDSFQTSTSKQEVKNLLPLLK